MTAAALVLIDFDKPDWSLFRNFDWIGLLSMAGFLGALEYVLEEGPRNDWFGDDTVLLIAWVSGLSAVVFFARVLTARAADRRPARVRATATSRSAACSPSCSASASTASPISTRSIWARSAATTR